MYASHISSFSSKAISSLLYIPLPYIHSTFPCPTHPSLSPLPPHPTRPRFQSRHPSSLVNIAGSHHTLSSSHSHTHNLTQPFTLSFYATPPKLVYQSSFTHGNAFRSPSYHVDRSTKSTNISQLHMNNRDQHQNQSASATNFSRWPGPAAFCLPQLDRSSSHHFPHVSIQDPSHLVFTFQNLALDTSNQYTLFVPIWRGKAIFDTVSSSPQMDRTTITRTTTDTYTPVFYTPDQVHQLESLHSSILYNHGLSHSSLNSFPVYHIGALQQTQFYAIDVSQLDEPPLFNPDIQSARDLRKTLSALYIPLDNHHPDDQSVSQANYTHPSAILHQYHPHLLIHASAIVYWAANERFCSSCGSPLRAVKQGKAKVCTNNDDTTCDKALKRTSLYPRTDPAVIMLVVDGPHCLLGRKKTWPTGRYSCLAGFVDIAESLEEALVREVYEEAGVHVDPLSIRFVASQPWPFPRSLMIGYIVQVAHPWKGLGYVDVNQDEMDDCKWFHRDYIHQAYHSHLNAPLSIPSKEALANVIIGKWLDETAQDKPS